MPRAATYDRDLWGQGCLLEPARRLARTQWRESPMSKLDELKAAILALSKEDFTKLRRWFDDRDREEIDEALEASLERGRRHARDRRGRFV